MLRKIILLLGAGALAKKLLSNKGSTSPASPNTDRFNDARQSDEAVGHVPSDLLRDSHPDGSDRADAHFRPDPTGQVDAADRESLRPVTMPAPRDAPGI